MPGRTLRWACALVGFVCVSACGGSYPSAGYGSSSSSSSKETVRERIERMEQEARMAEFARERKETPVAPSAPDRTDPRTLEESVPANERRKAMQRECDADADFREEEYAELEVIDLEDGTFSCSYAEHPFKGQFHVRPGGYSHDLWICGAKAPIRECLNHRLRIVGCGSEESCMKAAADACKQGAAKTREEWTVDVDSAEWFTSPGGNGRDASFLCAPSSEGRAAYAAFVQRKAAAREAEREAQAAREAAERRERERREAKARQEKADAEAAMCGARVAELMSDDDFGMPSSTVGCGFEMPVDRLYRSSNPHANDADASISSPVAFGRFVQPGNGKGIELEWSYEARPEGSNGDDVIVIHAENTGDEHMVKFRLRVLAFGDRSGILHEERKVDFDLAPGTEKSRRVAVPHVKGKSATDDVAAVVGIVTKLACYDGAPSGGYPVDLGPVIELTPVGPGGGVN